MFGKATNFGFATWPNRPPHWLRIMVQLLRHAHHFVLIRIHALVEVYTFTINFLLVTNSYITPCRAFAFNNHGGKSKIGNQWKNYFASIWFVCSPCIHLSHGNKHYVLLASFLGVPFPTIEAVAVGSRHRWVARCWKRRTHFLTYEYFVSGGCTCRLDTAIEVKTHRYAEVVAFVRWGDDSMFDHCFNEAQTTL